MTTQALEIASVQIDFGSIHGDLSYKRIGEIKAELDEAFAAGKLTPELLAQAVRAVRFDQGDGPPYSLGLDWLSEKAADMKDPWTRKVTQQGDRTIVKRVVPDPLAWLASFMDDADVMYRIICHGEVLNAVDDRVALGKLVFQTYVRYGAFNHDGMTRACLEAGVDPGLIRQMIMARVETFKPEAMDTFLKYGGPLVVGDELKDTLWGLLHKQELDSLLVLGAMLKPNLILSSEVSERIKYVMGNARAIEIFHLACAHLRSLSGVDMRLMAGMPRSIRALVAYSISENACDTDDVASFLLKLVMELPVESRGMFKLLRNKFQGVSAARLCRLVRNLDKAHEQARENDRMAFPVPDGLWNYVEDRLDEAGYVRGNLEYGKFFNRRLQKEDRQLQLVVGDVIYINDSFNHRFFPHEGDFVLVKTEQAHFLARNNGKTVMTVHMHPGEGQPIC